MKWPGGRTWNAVVRNWALRLQKKKGRVNKTSQCLSGHIGQAVNLYWDMLSCRQSKKQRRLIWSVLIKTRVTDFLQALVPPVLVSHYSLSSKEKEIFWKLRAQWVLALLGYWDVRLREERCIKLHRGVLFGISASTWSRVRNTMWHKPRHPLIMTWINKERDSVLILWQWAACRILIMEAHP